MATLAKWIAPEATCALQRRARFILYGGRVDGGYDLSLVPDFLQYGGRRPESVHLKDMLICSRRASHLTEHLCRHKRLTQGNTMNK